MLDKDKLLRKIPTSGILLTNLVASLEENRHNTENLSSLLHELEQAGTILISSIQVPKGAEFASSFQVLLQKYSVGLDGVKFLEPVGAFKKQRISVVKTKTIRKLKAKTQEKPL